MADADHSTSASSLIRLNRAQTGPRDTPSWRCPKIPISIADMTLLQLALCAVLLLASSARADIAAPQPHVSVPAPRKPTPPKPAQRPQPSPSATDNPRDPVSVARKTPEIAKRISQARSGPMNPTSDQPSAQLDEKVTQIPLEGQCGFAGCSSSTLVVFTYQTKGANTATSSVMALVVCPPIMRQGCAAVLAEVKPQGSLEQAR